jgi:prepilin-type N-terminal cleavage/methylation domain-containing protein
MREAVMNDIVIVKEMSIINNCLNSRFLLFHRLACRPLLYPTTSRSRGFTLLEFLVSFAVVTILLLGAAQLTLRSLITKKTSDCNVEAAELASSKLEHLRSLLFEKNELAEESFFERLKSHRGNTMFCRKGEITEVTKAIKKIQVECYAESYPHKNVHIVLFCSRELGF